MNRRDSLKGLFLLPIIGKTLLKIKPKLLIPTKEYGLWAQIPTVNVLKYNSLTENMIEQYVKDVFLICNKLEPANTLEFEYHVDQVLEKEYNRLSNIKQPKQ